jgi:hypothetical protein
MVRPLMHLAKKCPKRWAGLHPYVILSRHSSYGKERARKKMRKSNGTFFAKK